MKVFVLLTIYSNDKFIYIDKCLQSILASSRLPDKIVIIQDGPVSNEINQLIKDYLEKHEGMIFFYKLNKNSGLAVALNEGLKYCDADVIIRMDSDDIMHKDRIKKQIDFLQSNTDIDVVGSYIAEIDEENNIIKKCVKYPLTHNKCYEFFKYRDCFAHPAVAIRRRFFDDVGGYSEAHIDENKNEDTNLWYRGFLRGKHYANIPEVLLYYRRSSEFYKRRSGIKRSFYMLRDRLKMNFELEYGISGIFSAFLIFSFQLIPIKIKRLLYQYR
jgi:glycosyltransferase involved in cell wall biosynthesis